MKSRESLSAKLHDLCQNVYFQPPTGYMLRYPCIVYEFDGIKKIRADNRSYITYGEYSIKYITRDPNDETKILISDLPMCEMNRSYTSDNLYHYVYKIYH